MKIATTTITPSKRPQGNLRSDTSRGRSFLLRHLASFRAGLGMSGATAGPVEAACGGGRNSSKSHGVICQVLLDDCVRIPGLKFLFLRSIGKAASESFDDLLRKATPHLIDYYKPSRLRIDLPNGSRVLLGGFSNDRDIDKYVGIEYDGVVIEGEFEHVDDQKDMPVNETPNSSTGSKSARSPWKQR